MGYITFCCPILFGGPSEDKDFCRCNNNQGKHKSNDSYGYCNESSIESTKNE